MASLILQAFFSSLGKINALFFFFVLPLALCTIIVIILSGSYIVLRIKQWRVEHTRFEIPGPFDQAAYNNNNRTLPPPEAPFDYTSKDMVNGFVMAKYAQKFGFDYGLSAEECLSLFRRAEDAVRPDKEVVTAFIAKANDNLCGCAMSSTKFIFANKEETVEIPVVEIISFSCDNGRLDIHCGEEIKNLTVQPGKDGSICEICNVSLKACQEEIAAAK